MSQELEQQPVPDEQEAIEGSISKSGCAKIWLNCSCHEVFCLNSDNFRRIHNPKYVLCGDITCPGCGTNYKLFLELEARC